MKDSRERMIVTDLDGTLLDDASRLSAENRAALERLGEEGTVRVVATGRSLYSARRVIDAEFPIDYLVFSSGAGTVAWRSQELIAAHNMTAEEAAVATSALLCRRMDFMVHRSVPDNHHFYYHRSGAENSENSDFERRCQRYREFAVAWDGHLPTHPVCQVIGVEPSSAPRRYQELAEELAALTVILTTSPLDRVSRWIEIFPPQVSKSQAAQAIAERHRVPIDEIAAVGNDFNDRDLLAWAKQSFVVANAPAELCQRYTVVPANTKDGFAQVVDALYPR